jgi:hypothetical protein
MLSWISILPHGIVIGIFAGKEHAAALIGRFQTEMHLFELTDDPGKHTY